MLTPKWSPVSGQKCASHLLVLWDIFMQFDSFVVVVLLIIISSCLLPLNSIISSQLLSSCLRHIFRRIHEQKEVVKISYRTLIIDNCYPFVLLLLFDTNTRSVKNSWYVMLSVKLQVSILYEDHYQVPYQKFT